MAIVVGFNAGATYAAVRVTLHFIMKDVARAHWRINRLEGLMMKGNNGHG